MEATVWQVETDSGEWLATIWRRGKEQYILSWADRGDKDPLGHFLSAEQAERYALAEWRVGTVRVWPLSSMEEAWAYQRGVEHTPLWPRGVAVVRATAQALYGPDVEISFLNHSLVGLAS